MKARSSTIKNLINDESKRIIAYTMIWGLLSHGFMLFNKLSWHSDLARGFHLDWVKPIALGRWMRALLSFLVGRAFGGNNISIPLFYGVFSIFFIGVTSYIIIKLFDINSKRLQFLLCGLMVSFPVVTGTFGYMYTSPYYFFALSLSVLAVYVAREAKGVLPFLIAMLCICCSLGVYQAYFPVAVSLYVIILIYGIVKGKYTDFLSVLKAGLYFLGTLGAALVGYLVIAKVGMKVLHVTAESYQGIASIGESGFSAYINAFITAYKRFFLSYSDARENLFPMGMGVVQMVIIALSVILALWFIVQQFKKNALLGIVLALLIAILPLCFNLIYVMAASSPDSFMHALMLYGQIMLYVFLICGLQHLSHDSHKIIAGLRGVAVAALALILVMDAYYDNLCYLKAEMLQQQTISNFTVLVAKIKSTEGYNDKMPVCFVMTGKKDASVSKNTFFDDICIAPFNSISPYHDARDFKAFLAYWCGFSPKIISSSKFKDHEDVVDMPDYPDDGGIKIIDGTVVVKW